MNTVDTVAEAAKAIPPVSASAFILAGIPLSEWVLLCSGILILFQLIFLLKEKLYVPWKESRYGPAKRKPR